MANYLLTYHGGGMPQEPAAQQKLMAAWGEWMGKVGPNLVDGGNPIAQAKTIAANGSVSNGGGPNPVSGYSIIKADSLDQAVAAAQGCPILGEGGGSIEVCETFAPPM